MADAPQAAPQGQPDFVNDDIFAILGLTNVSDDQKRDMISSMLRTVQNRVHARLFDIFSEEERTSLEAAFGSKDYDTVNTLLESKGMPDFMTLIGQEVLVYKHQLYDMVHNPTPKE